jgi:hypothetical protein
MAVLEVLKPTPQRAVDVVDDHSETASLGAPGLPPQRVFELPPALLARPSLAPLEVIAEEVKALLLAGIDHLGLVRVQLQSHLGGPLLHPLERSVGLGLTPTQDNKV